MLAQNSKGQELGAGQGAAEREREKKMDASRNTTRREMARVANELNVGEGVSEGTREN